jgi:hypothetical protein
MTCDEMARIREEAVLVSSKATTLLMACSVLPPPEYTSDTETLCRSFRCVDGDDLYTVLSTMECCMLAVECACKCLLRLYRITILNEKLLLHYHRGCAVETDCCEQ